MNFLPRVTYSVPPDRDYQMTITQTKIVYDQLLMDKQAKLNQALMQKKEAFDKECSHIEKNKGKEAALEYGVKAQAYINEMQVRSEKELLDQQQDYQTKLNGMHAQLEARWKKENF